jgi:hypothetical protein
MLPALRQGAGVALLRIGGLLLATMLLAACDKCGDSVFRVEGGPSVCKDEKPRTQ